MSSIGTGIAAGVAQTTQTSQQVSRQRDKRRADNKSQLKELRDSFEIHMRAVDEGDEPDTPAQLHIDQDVPEHLRKNAVEKEPREEAVEPYQQESGQQPIQQSATHEQAQAKPKADPLPPPVMGPDSALYHHLDLEA